MRNEPHSNGVAERAFRSISDTATTLLYESHLPSSFWTKAVGTAGYIHNQVLTSANQGLSPHQLMFGKIPDLSLIRVFGCMSYVHVQKDKRTEFSPHVEKAILVGYLNQ
jgi:hypothetical protein